MALQMTCSKGHTYIQADEYRDWPPGAPHCQECYKEWVDGQRVEIDAATFTHPDTLSFCDEDIQAMFRVNGSITTHFTFEPLLAQLIKELRLLRDSLCGEKPMELAELRGALSEIYFLATNCVSVNAPVETHSLAKSIVSRILSAGCTIKPAWFIHDWERALWEERGQG